MDAMKEKFLAVNRNISVAPGQLISSGELTVAMKLVYKNADKDEVMKSDCKAPLLPYWREIILHP